MDMHLHIDRIPGLSKRKTGNALQVSFLHITLIISVLIILNPCLVYGVIIDRIAAVVNGEVITLSELETTARPILQKYINKDMTRQEKEAKKQEILHHILPNLIDEHLVEEEIKKLDITVSKEEIEDTIDSLCKQNYMSRDELVAKLENDGKTLKEYKNEIKREIEKARLINREVSSKIVITDEEVKKYIKRHPSKEDYYNNGKLYILQHICIVPKDPNDPESKEKSRRRAEEAYKALKKGKSFKEVIEHYSDLSSDEKDGYLGSFTLKEMAPFVRQAVVGLKPGEFSRVIDTPMGWQIFRLKEITQGRGAEDRQNYIEEVRRKLYRKEINRRFREWLKGLRAKSTIRILL